MSAENFDLMIIGAGPAGYVAAERAGQAGLKVLLVEREELGGVCLNWGCIPTKTLLNSAKMYYQATHGDAFGLEIEKAVFNLEKAMGRKLEVQKKLRAGIAGLMKKFKVTVVDGLATILAPGKIQVGENVYEGKHILVATGSRPAKPPIPGADKPHVLDSSGILEIEQLPKKLTVIGGGVIGLEFACFFASVGIPVTVIEMLPEIGGTIDPDLAKVLRQELKQKGVTFELGAKVTSIDDDKVNFTDAKGAEQSAEADMVLMSVGRVANTDGLGLEAAGVETTRAGIIVDDHCRTNVPGIWAAGDVTGKILLAHVASRQGEVVVNNIAGKTDGMRYHAVPAVIYTSPEVAFCGMSEAHAETEGVSVDVAKWFMQANGRFLAESDGKGMVKVIIDRVTRQILGVHMVGHTCSEMIHSASTLIEMEARVDELKELIFPHPTASEAIRDAVFHL